MEQVLGAGAIFYGHLTDEGSEAQRAQMTCLRERVSLPFRGQVAARDS